MARGSQLLYLPRAPVLRRTISRLAYSPSRTIPLRAFHSSNHNLTDGVFKALTEMRVRKPWIEALREKKEAEQNPAAVKQKPVQVDLTPKKMSDSYVSLVLPLSVSAPQKK